MEASVVRPSEREETKERIQSIIQLFGESDVWVDIELENQSGPDLVALGDTGTHFAGLKGGARKMVPSAAAVALKVVGVSFKEFGEYRLIGNREFELIES